MTKMMSLIVPALALSFALQSTAAEAAPHSVRAHSSAQAHKQAPAKAPVQIKVWVSGHFEFVQGKLIWVKGHYKVAPRAGARYIPGHWEMKRGKRVWVAGYWR